MPQVSMMAQKKMAIPPRIHTQTLVFLGACGSAGGGVGVDMIFTFPMEMIQLFTEITDVTYLL